ncbi:MAG TPA: hypothetical protein VH044_12180, partial [Polyangiaceae bacterium]|nr:hypothetical protein [Polyangiaceae bacterium]
FGSFEPERAPVVYGLTTNIETFSLWRIAFHEYAAVARDVRRAPGWRERLGIVTHGPGWSSEPLARPARSKDRVS